MDPRGDAAGDSRKPKARTKTNNTGGTKKPVRPRSSYNFFFKEQRQELLQEAQERGAMSIIETVSGPQSESDGHAQKKLPNLFGAIGIIIGKRWNGLSAQGRKKYEDMANEDSKRYKRERQAYKQSVIAESALCRAASEGRLSRVTGYQNRQTTRAESSNQAVASSSATTIEPTTHGAQASVGPHLECTAASASQLREPTLGPLAHPQPSMSSFPDSGIAGSLLYAQQHRALQQQAALLQQLQLQQELGLLAAASSAQQPPSFLATQLFQTQNSVLNLRNITPVPNPSVPLFGPEYRGSNAASNNSLTNPQYGQASESNPTIPVSAQLLALSRLLAAPQSRQGTDDTTNSEGDKAEGSSSPNSTVVSLGDRQDEKKAHRVPSVLPVGPDLRLCYSPSFDLTDFVGPFDDSRSEDDVLSSLGNSDNNINNNNNNSCDVFHTINVYHHEQPDEECRVPRNRSICHAYPPFKPYQSWLSM